MHVGVTNRGGGCVWSGSEEIRGEVRRWREKGRNGEEWWAREGVGGGIRGSEEMQCWIGLEWMHVVGGRMVLDMSSGQLGQGVKHGDQWVVG
jgi:hypothetical protein